MKAVSRSSMPRNARNSLMLMLTVTAVERMMKP